MWRSRRPSLAEAGRWCRPVVTGETDFLAQGARHPVVEAALAGSATAFVPNDCDLSPERRLLLLTGPNMAGKSTFLRQNALLVMLAQAGLPVPADSFAHRGGRPAVLPGRRGRRSGARALDLHGGDDRDGGDPASGRPARWSWSTRSAAAPRRSTGWRSPGRCWRHCMARSAAARFSLPIFMSSRALAERTAAAEAAHDAGEGVEAAGGVPA